MFVPCISLHDHAPSEQNHCVLNCNSANLLYYVKCLDKVLSDCRSIFLHVVNQLVFLVLRLMQSLQDLLYAVSYPVVRHFTCSQKCVKVSCFCRMLPVATDVICYSFMYLIVSYCCLLYCNVWVWTCVLMSLKAFSLVSIIQIIACVGQTCKNEQDVSSVTFLDIIFLHWLVCSRGTSFHCFDLSMQYMA